MRNFISRSKYFAAMVLFVLTSSVLSGGPAMAAHENGDKGTLKIHEQGTPSGTEDNDPKVCTFNVEGFGFDKNQTGFLVFDVQGGDGPTGVSAGPYAFGPTNATGYYASQYFNLQPGHYKATLYGKQLPGGQLDEDEDKAKSKVFKVFCEETLAAVPTTPLATTPTCEVSNETVTPPVITGVVWSPSVSTVLQPGHSVTYTASPASGYRFTAGAQTSWTFTNSFDVSSCNHVTSVTPATPLATTPNCEVPNETITPPTIPGIVWTPSTPATLLPNGSATYTASPAQGYVFTQGAQTSWTFANHFLPNGCGDGEETPPQKPTVSVSVGACVPTVLPTGTATVTVTNPNAKSVNYIVTLGTSTQPLTVAAGATESLSFTGLAAGTYAVHVTGDDDTEATTQVTVAACPATTPTGGSGGQVLGASTTVPSVRTELVNTGASIVLPTILAVSMTLTAAGVMYGSRQRRGVDTTV